MVKHNLTGAHYGINSWLQQRLTAIIMLIFFISLILFIIKASFTTNTNIASWQNFFHYTLVKIFVQVFFISMILHAWVGVRDIWMDYVKLNSLKMSLHLLTFLWLLASLIYSIKIIWT